jgi:hypothetical protein
MKIFSSLENPKISDASSTKITKKNTKRGKNMPIKKDKISESEVREKIAFHVEASNSAKSQMLKKNSKDFGAGFMRPKEMSDLPIESAAENSETPSLKESHLLMTDVKLNDPSDSNTQEKLKSVLRSGGFNFNTKEKETLEKILGGS